MFCFISLVKEYVSVFQIRKGEAKLIISNKNVKQCLNYAGKKLHAPEQRLLLGATALAIQPWIDLKNKDVDEETRMMSVARTLGKIIAGTAVGVAVRYAGIEGVKRLCKCTPILNKDGTKVIGLEKDRGILVPLFQGKNNFKPVSLEEFEANMNRYIKAMGTFAATIAMIYTNFAIDAPFTKWLTNEFNTILTKQKESEVEK